MSAPSVEAPSGRRALWIPGVEVAALLAFALLWLGACRDLVSAAAGAQLASAVVALLAALVALAVADFGSGFAHWLCDRYFDEHAPIIGPLIVRTFREHHADLQALVAHGFVELNGASALILLPFLAAARLAPLPGSSTLWFAAHAALLAFALAILLTNCVHRWAHAARVPRPVAWLQQCGVLLRPGAHARHHRGDHTQSFCITTGWLNPLLDRTGFFARLERAAARLGAPPTI